MEQNQYDYDVIVVGGGASGMMAAGRAGSLGKRVLLLEKNTTLGKKLAISGGGRCNITNATYDIRALLERYGQAKDFLFSPFSQFGVEDTFTFFTLLGLPLVVQAQQRVFPQTEKASDVVRVLHEYLKKNNVTIETGVLVEKILFEKHLITGIQTTDRVYRAKKYIIATGGVSHPETGSTGDGFAWLRTLGHTVKDPTPTIVPIGTRDTWSHALSGVSLADMKITVFLDGKKQFHKRGGLLFTHFGLSGPLILNLSGTVWDMLQSGQVTGQIDMYPDKDIGTLDADFVAHFELHKNKTLKNTLKDIVPLGMVPGIVILLSHLDFDKKVHSVTKEERRMLIGTLKALPVHITELLGFDKAVIADGGVILEEIDMKTMRSKVCDNLYVTGDLLHVTRPSGGYSLQLCWTTGFVAGSDS
ncbi:NAD(P)/FAD-dependent oxidoreductase [Candidatus Nomurabacteria bacterium]|nr:NAD(P)/FAD-dependent oxidoreductase [Candidatus Nomurabacteria bacterium]